jgi:competence protein CoiA
MLIARLSNGELFSLLDKNNVDELRDLRYRSEFYCPGCKEAVMLKLGVKKRPHFAHFKQSNCHAYSEPESSYHLEGKKLLYEWLEDQSLLVELEKYLPDLAQIPDLYLTYKGSQIALEYQCSTIPQDIFLRRTSGYLKKEITPIWILGDKRITQVTPNIIQLHEMDLLTARTFKNSSKQLYIFTINPFNKRFTIYSNIYPLTYTRAFATTNSLLFSSISFQNIVKPLNSAVSPALLSIWLKQKYNWRFHMFRNSSPSVHYLKIYYYNHHRHFSLFPAEVGIPTHYLAYIQTPSYVWQAWVLEFINKRGVQHMFTFKEVLADFQTMIDKKIFTIRSLPMVEGHFSFAIMDYLNALCFTGIVKKLSSTIFVIKKDVMYPKNIDEALRKDEEILTRLKGFLLNEKNI